MFKNLKTIRRIKKAALAAREETDENGRSIIRMSVKDDGDFLSPYSDSAESVISSDVADFLDNAAEGLDLKKPVHIIMSGATIDENERKTYPAAIKKYYRGRIAETSARLQKNLTSGIVMAIIGAAILLACVYLHLNDISVVAELIDIVAWVFAWEAVDVLFLARPLLKREELHNCRLYEAEVTYI